MADRVPTTFGKIAGNALTGGRAGRAHFSTAEVEGERYAAAERLGELIERREQLLPRSAEADVAAELAQVAEQMGACEAKIRAIA
jgi:hypothetical protein